MSGFSFAMILRLLSFVGLAVAVRIAMRVAERKGFVPPKWNAPPSPPETDEEWHWKKPE